MALRSQIRLGWLALALPVALGGCGAPVAFQVASLAADGISYMATGKSLFDHGLSAATEQDCAMLRVVTEGAPCRDEEMALAEAEPDPAPEDTLADAPPARRPEPVQVAELAAVQAPEPAPVPAEGKAGADRYLIIASVPSRAGAEKMARKHDGTVLQAEVKGRPTYRVAVGPFSPEDLRKAGQRLETAGIRDAWPLKVVAANAAPVRVRVQLASLEN